MKNPGLNACAICFILVLGVYHMSVAQDIGIDTKGIEAVIREWNFANNNRNTESFRNVYGERLLFYTQDLSEEKAIRLKQHLFGLKPNFQQRIITEITYTPYTSGLIKCEFTKEVFETTRWKKYPSYLLVSYDNNRFQIVGESDNATDRVLKYALNIGEPMKFQERPDADTIDRGSTSVVTAPPTTLDSAKSRSNGVSSLFSDISAMGMVTIPKGYIFILIGLLAVGALMIFAADSVRSTKRITDGAMIVRQDEAEKVVEDFKMQSVFEDFVTTLFDPLYFRYKRPKAERVYAGTQVPEAMPDLIFEFNQKDIRTAFAIKAQYYKYVAKNEVQLFPADVLQGFRRFDEKEMDVYYVLGFGGTPDDPKELFFLPAKAIGEEYVTKGALRSFSKSGMFYYNHKTGRIQ